MATLWAPSLEVDRCPDDNRIHLRSQSRLQPNHVLIDEFGTGARSQARAQGGASGDLGDVAPHRTQTDLNNLSNLRRSHLANAKRADDSLYQLDWKSGRHKSY